MNRRKLFALAVLFLTVEISIIPYVSAGLKGGGEEDPYQGSIAETQSCYDQAHKAVWYKKPYHYVTGTFCWGWDKLKKAIARLTWDVIIAWINRQLTFLVKTFLGFLQKGLTLKPDWDAYDEMMLIILQILVPFLYIQILMVGAYFIFASVDPGQRSKARSMLGKLIMALILVSTAKHIYILGFDIMNGLTDSIFQRTYLLLGSPSGGGATIASKMAAFFIGILGFAMFLGVGWVILGWILIYLLIVVIIVFARWSMIVLLYIIFPFTIFLYFFEWTRNIGGDLMMKTILWLSMGPVMALIISITIMALANVLVPAAAQTALVSNLGTLGAETQATHQTTDPTAVPAPAITFNQHPTQKAPDLSKISTGTDVLARIIALMMFLAGIIALIAVPLMMGQLLKWVGGAVAAAGMTGLAQGGAKPERWKNMSMVIGGGMMMGQGPTSIVNAATTAAYMSPEVARGDSILPSFGSQAGGAGGVQPAATGRGFFKNLSDVFADGGSTASKYRTEMNEGGVFGTPEAGSPGGVRGGVLSSAPGSGTAGTAGGPRPGGGYGPGGMSSSIGGAGPQDVMRNADYSPEPSKVPQSRAQSLDTSQQPAEIFGPDGKPLSIDTTMTSTRGPQATFTSKEVVSGVLPALNIAGRVDTAFDGFRDFGRAFQALFYKGAGASVGGALGFAGRGVGRLLMSVVPLSPFMPVRMAGRILLSIASSHLPPGVQNVAFWMGRTMMGMSLRQMAMRTHWADRNRYYHSQYKSLDQKMGQLQAEEKGLTGKGALSQPETARLGKVREEMKAVGGKMDSVAADYTKMMDRIGYGTTMFGKVLPENPDFVTYQKFLNQAKSGNIGLMDRVLDRRSGNPGLYEAYIRNSTMGEAEMKKDPTPMSALLDLGGKFNSGTLKGKDKDDFKRVVEDAVKLHKPDADFKGLKAAKDAAANATGDEKKSLEKLYDDKVMEWGGKLTKGEFYTAGLLTGMGITDKADQERFLKANPNMITEDASGKIMRSRFLRLDGNYGEAAQKMEYVYQRDYFKVLTQEMGVPYEEAVVRSRALNLRLYKDQEGGVYMAPYDMGYVAAMMNREDWATADARREGFKLDKPATVRYRSFGNEDYAQTPSGWQLRPGAQGQGRDVKVHEVAVLTLSNDEMYKGKPVRGPDGEHVATIGHNKALHDGNKMLVAKVSDWADSSSTAKIVNGQMEPVDWNDLRKKLQAGEKVDFSQFQVQDPMAPGTGRMIQATGAKVGEDGKIQFEYQAWRHFGQYTVPDERGRPNTYFTSAALVGETSMAALVMGTPRDFEMGRMTRDDIVDTLVEKDWKRMSASQLRSMNDTQLNNELKDMTQSERKRFDDMLKERAKAARSDTTGKAAKLLGAAGLGSAEDAAKMVAEADKRYYLHPQEMELLASKGFSREEMQALKAAVWKKSKEMGVNVHSLSFYDDAGDMNPMVVSVEGGGAHLRMNLSQVKQEGVKDFIRRADSHYLPHELDHVRAEKELGSLRVRSDKLMKETVDRKNAPRFRRLQGMNELGFDRDVHDNMLREVRADMGKDAASQMRLWGENVLPQLEGCSELGDEDMANGARISAFLRIYGQEFGRMATEKARQSGVGSQEVKNLQNAASYARRLEGQYDALLADRYRYKDAYPDRYGKTKEFYGNFITGLWRDEPGGPSQKPPTETLPPGPDSGATAGQGGGLAPQPMGDALHDRGAGSQALDSAKAAETYDTSQVSGVNTLMRRHADGQRTASKTLAVDFSAVGLGEGAGRHLTGEDKDQVAARMAEHMVRSGQMTAEEAGSFRQATGQLTSLDLINKARQTTDARHIIRHEELHAKYDGKDDDLRRQWASMDAAERTGIESWYRRGWGAKGPVDGADALKERLIETELKEAQGPGAKTMGATGAAPKEDETAIKEPLITRTGTVRQRWAFLRSGVFRRPDKQLKDTLFLNPIRQAFGGSRQIETKGINESQKTLDWMLGFNDVIDRDIKGARAQLAAEDAKKGPARDDARINFIRKKIVLQEHINGKHFEGTMTQADSMRYREIDNGLHVAYLAEGMMGKQTPESIRVGQDNVRNYDDLMRNYGWLTSDKPVADVDRRKVQAINNMANACQVWDDYYGRRIDLAQGVPNSLYHPLNADKNPVPPEKMAKYYRDLAVNSGVVGKGFMDNALTTFEAAADQYWDHNVERLKWYHDKVAAPLVAPHVKAMRTIGLDRDADYVEGKGAPQPVDVLRGLLTERRTLRGPALEKNRRDIEDLMGVEGLTDEKLKELEERHLGQNAKK
jgi:hypothetical protein